MDCEKFLSMLDGYIDSSISDNEKAQMLEHARVCEACSAELKSAEALRDILGGIDDNVSVPLGAQAAWRNAVKAERRKKQTRRIYKAAMYVAAAFVAMVCVGGGLKLFNKPDTAGTGEPQVSDYSFVEADGRSAEIAEPSARTAAVKISSKDISRSADVVCQLVSEFNGSVGINSVNGGTAYITASIPSDEISGFLGSVGYAGDVLSRSAEDGNSARVNITITIVKPSK